jgi:hypothetical protein
MDFKINDENYGNAGQSFSNEEFKISNVGDDDFPPSEDFLTSNEDDEEYLSSGNFQSSEDDYAVGGHSFPSDKLKSNNVDVDFPPSEDF